MKNWLGNKLRLKKPLRWKHTRTALVGEFKASLNFVETFVQGEPTVEVYQGLK